MKNENVNKWVIYKKTYTHVRAKIKRLYVLQMYLISVIRNIRVFESQLHNYNLLSLSFDFHPIN